MAGYTHPEIRALETALLYTPTPLRKAHLRRLERLIRDVDPDRLYTYEYVFHRITRFKPDARGEVLLPGRGLWHDLGLLLRQIGFSAPLEPVETDGEVMPIASVAAACRVTTATVRRWGVTGLPLGCFLLDDGRCTLCVGRTALERFLAARRARASRSAARMTEEERRTLLTRARVLREADRLAPAAVVRRLVEESGRSAPTIRRILCKRREARSAKDPSPARSSGRLAGKGEELVGLYRQGAPVRALASRFRCSRPTVYRALHRALVENALRLKIRYVPSPEFARQDAEEVCLGEGGLFTYPPEIGPGALRPPAGVPPYLAALYDIPLLARAREKALFRKYNYVKYRMATLQERIRLKGYRAELLEQFEALGQAADAVRRVLVRCNLRLVVSIAKRHVGPLANLFELVSEGNVCLLRAVECYDYTRNARFATYASWAVSKHFARVVPERNYHLATFVTGQEERIAAVGDGKADAREQSETLAHIRAVIGRAAAHLTDRERTIIQSHYGTDGRPARTLEEIGKLFGLTRERIRQIEARALRKLRGLIAPEAIEGFA